MFFIPRSGGAVLKRIVSDCGAGCQASIQAYRDEGQPDDAAGKPGN